MAELKTFDYSLYSVPAAFALAHASHLIKVVLIAKSGGGWNNLDPRSNIERAKSTMKKEQHRIALKAGNVNANALETLGFWAAAVVAGHMAKLPTSTLNGAASVYIASRIVFTLIYIFQSNEAHAAARSLTWSTGIGAAAYLFIKAGNRINYV